jgi:xylulokinase
MKADVTKKAVSVMSADAATAMGAAILAGVGTGVYGSFSEAVDAFVNVKRSYEPVAANCGAYERGYQTYIALYEKLKDLMHREDQ